MRLKKSRNSADEELISLLNKGYQLLNWLKQDYSGKREDKTFDPNSDHRRYAELVNEWRADVVTALKTIFPTELEANQFLHPPHVLRAIAADDQDDYKAGSLRIRLDLLLKGLDEIRKATLARYTDLPQAVRLFVEDIDSFHKVRDVNPAAVMALLADDGYLKQSEEVVQRGLEKILSEHFHKKDWGGEYNDLYSSNVVVNGARRPTAFLLKGMGLRAKTMEIAHCGKNGDQLVRLFESPADLFVVQFVGNVSEAIIKDVEGKVERLCAKGKEACFMIIDGLDTARLLHAYGVL